MSAPVNIISRILASDDVVLGLDVPNKLRALEEAAVILERRRNISHAPVLRAAMATGAGWLNRTRTWHRGSSCPHRGHQRASLAFRAHEVCGRISRTRWQACVGSVRDPGSGTRERRTPEDPGDYFRDVLQPDFSESTGSHRGAGCDPALIQRMDER
jgi:hypothetical protein